MPFAESAASGTASPQIGAVPKHIYEFDVQAGDERAARVRQCGYVDADPAGGNAKI